MFLSRTIGWNIVKHQTPITINITGDVLFFFNLTTNIYCGNRSQGDQIVIYCALTTSIMEPIYLYLVLVDRQ